MLKWLFWHRQGVEIGGGEQRGQGGNGTEGLELSAGLPKQLPLRQENGLK